MAGKKTEDGPFVGSDINQVCLVDTTVLKEEGRLVRENRHEKCLVPPVDFQKT